MRLIKLSHAVAFAWIGMMLVVSSGCQPTAKPAPAKTTGGPPAPPPPPGVIAQPAPSLPPSDAGDPAPAAAVALDAPLPDDPVELAKMSVEALAEKVRLISGVHDLDSAKAVSGTFPAVDARQRQLAEKLANRVMAAEALQRIQSQFKAQHDELDQKWAKEYHRVAFIPGAWEHMHPDLTPFADLTPIPEDAEGLEREATRMLTQAIELLRQVTDANKAVELSPRYRVATCRLSSVLTKLSVARGGTGAREVHSPQIQSLRQQFDAERRRMGAIAHAHNAMTHGERPPSGAAASLATGASPTDQIVQELRSGDIPRARNAMLRLGQEPGSNRATIGAELIKLLEFEPIRGSAIEALKHGWFGREQIPQIRDAILRLQDRGERYSLAEGISRIPDLDGETIEFLATLFNESPGDAVRVLRNVGPAAESAAERYAASPNAEVRKTVCELLRDIGTEASLPTLQKLAQDRDRGVASKAQEAIREIGKPVSERPHLRDR